jgi:hypothetical protein
MSRRSTRTLRAVAAAILAAAPTAGDLGSCGQPAELLDADKFFANKRAIDCTRCEACGLTTTACTRACADERTENEVFPALCAPLVHDGEVCLDALLAADCDDVARYVADEGATLPTECAFCPADARGAGGEGP